MIILKGFFNIMRLRVGVRVRVRVRVRVKVKELVISS
jgi:hypothetical protein